jgi:hypothetical protein
MTRGHVRCQSCTRLSKCLPASATRLYWTEFRKYSVTVRQQEYSGATLWRMCVVGGGKGGLLETRISGCDFISKTVCVHLHLAPILRMSGIIPPPALYAFVAWTGNPLPLREFIMWRFMKWAEKLECVKWILYTVLVTCLEILQLEISRYLWKTSLTGHKVAL